MMSNLLRTLVKRGGASAPEGDSAPYPYYLNLGLDNEDMGRVGFTSPRVGLSSLLGADAQK
jgi:hypothetical protein